MTMSIAVGSRVRFNVNGQPGTNVEIVLASGRRTMFQKPYREATGIVVGFEFMGCDGRNIRIHVDEDERRSWLIAPGDLLEVLPAQAEAKGG